MPALTDNHYIRHDALINPDDDQKNNNNTQWNSSSSDKNDYPTHPQIRTTESVYQPPKRKGRGHSELRGQGYFEFDKEYPLASAYPRREGERHHAKDIDRPNSTSTDEDCQNGKERLTRSSEPPPGAVHRTREPDSRKEPEEPLSDRRAQNDATAHHDGEQQLSTRKRRRNKKPRRERRARIYESPSRARWQSQLELRGRGDENQEPGQRRHSITERSRCSIGNSSDGRPWRALCQELGEDGKPVEGNRRIPDVEAPDDDVSGDENDDTTQGRRSSKCTTDFFWDDGFDYVYQSSHASSLASLIFDDGEYPAYLPPDALDDGFDALREQAKGCLSRQTTVDREEPLRVVEALEKPLAKGEAPHPLHPTREQRSRIVEKRAESNNSTSRRDPRPTSHRSKFRPRTWTSDNKQQLTRPVSRYDNHRMFALGLLDDPYPEWDGCDLRGAFSLTFVNSRFRHHTR